MEGTSTRPHGFNKRRAEGKDNNDKPKTYQLKVRKLNPVNTTSYIQILGTGMDTQDTSPSILLFFDKQRFIFNAGEGLQRYCTEHKIKLSKIDHIFLSRVCSETAGGLPGLLLTLAGMGEEGMSVNIWGPSDLQYLVDAMLSFIPNNAVHTHCFGSGPDADIATYSGLEKSPDCLIDDEVVKISAILIKPRFPSLVGSYEEPSGPMGLPRPHDRPILRPGDISVIYVCELPEIKGKFDPKKAREFGLSPGPKYRELQLGSSVKSDEQNIMVHPSDVLGPSVPGPIVLLVDCPTQSHLQELVDIQSLNHYYTDQQCDGSKFVNCIIHLSPSSITRTVMYQRWMRRFDGAQHIMAGHEIKNMEIPILKASARVATRLNYLCPQFFPAPGFLSPRHLYVQDSNGLSEGSGSELCESVSGENLLKFQLRPYKQLGLDRSGIPSVLVQKEIVDELIAEVPDIVDSVARVRQLWNESPTDTTREPTSKEVVMVEEAMIDGNASSRNIELGLQDINNSEEGTVDLKCISMSRDNHECAFPRSLENISREDMEIVLLGTGSSQPSKYRNVSSIFLNLFSKGGLLLDCGEGTLGQLKRRYGVRGADDVLRSLKFIWISHIHADHHTGLTRILARRCEMLRGVQHDPLLVIGPMQLKRFLDAYQKLEDLDVQFLDCRYTTKTSLTASESTLKLSRNAVDSATHLTSMKNLKIVLQEACLEDLVSIPVVHCPHAFGLVVKAAERSNINGKIIPGWKFVYSGDTRPCAELVDAARGATVLLHEATFEDGMVEEAIARNHSTTKEAIEVGDSADAYRIILTHFSQRYPKIPVFDETHMHKTCIGFDLMSINLADLPVLPKVLPYLKLLFRNEIIADESENTECSLL